MKKAFVFHIDLLSTYRGILYTICALFFLGILFAFVNTGNFKLTAYLEFITQMEAVADISPNIFWGILINNLRAVSMMQLFGLLVVFPSFIVFTNGYILGLFIDFAIRSVQMSNSFSIVRVMITSVVPHAIIEIPTFLLAGATATLLGLKIYFPSKIEPKLTRKAFLLHFLRAYIFVIVPFIILAAAIEGYITPIITQTIEAAVNQKVEPKLNQEAVLTKEDVQNIISEPLKKIDTNIPRELSWMMRLWGVFVFDDFTFTRLKETRSGESEVIHFRFSDDSYLWGYVSEFSNPQIAQGYDEMYRGALHVLSTKEKDASLTTNGKWWTYKRGSETFYGTSVSVGRYGYVLWYGGSAPDNLLLFSLAQSDKLKLLSN